MDTGKNRTQDRTDEIILQEQVRRYLVEIDSDSIGHIRTDCLVIGAGIAGLRAAIEAAKYCNVTTVCKAKLSDSNTWNAQGGIATVLEDQDSFDSHIADTLQTGCGLCDEKTVEEVIRQGPELIKELINWGTDFDKAAGKITTAIEGGHSHPRVAHAHGDETGKIIAQALIKIAQQNPRIKIMENFFAIDLLTCPDANNRCIGLIGQTSSEQISGEQSRTSRTNKNRFCLIFAANTVLATGGAGQLYRETTNPAVATGDGLAMAWRAGAILQDLEFVQFHPTALYLAGASRTLITEALRGEGAILRDNKGKAFMKDYHPAAELAPRDIVSRACLLQMLKTKSTNVFLDVRHFDKQVFAKRFPLIFKVCSDFHIDISTSLIPVRPSAHYMIGGVTTDSSARTNVPNLYSCGEAAATGMHGANRLASNSLLEGLALGKIAGFQASHNPNPSISGTTMPHYKYTISHSDRSDLDLEDMQNSLKAIMWRSVGIIRNRKKLAEAESNIKFWQRYVLDKVFDSPFGWECQNMLTICLLIAQSAAMRRESRGVHFRSDHPNTDDKNFKRHIKICSKPTMQ